LCEEFVTEHGECHEKKGKALLRSVKNHQRSYGMPWRGAMIDCLGPKKIVTSKVVL
jgi:hypothetical protein